MGGTPEPSDEVLKFLRKHENKKGPAGEFVRSCILTYERAEIMTRDELRSSAQMDLLLDCFPCVEENNTYDGF